MARKRKLLVPEAREALERLKSDVVRDKQQMGESSSQMLAGRAGADSSAQGTGSYFANPLTNYGAQSSPTESMATMLNIPYDAKGDNGELTTRAAGKIGGNLGGPMVKKLIALAQEQLHNQQPSKGHEQ